MECDGAEEGGDEGDEAMLPPSPLAARKGRGTGGGRGRAKPVEVAVQEDVGLAVTMPPMPHLGDG